MLNKVRIKLVDAECLGSFYFNQNPDITSLAKSLRNRYTVAATIECGKNGEAAVAEAVGSSTATIKQITSGVKLPSGNPRGVGPGLAARFQRGFQIGSMLSPPCHLLTKPITKSQM